MTIILTSFLSAIGAGILTLIVLLIKWMVRKMTADTLTLKAVIHDAYFRQSRYILTHEEKTRSESENHDHLYRAYKAQGLNGTGDELHERVKEIPLDTDRL